jgi:hypothetical protein
MISLPSESWKTILDYNYDENKEHGFGSILPYRAVNKAFCQLVLECIKKVTISIDIDNPVSDLRIQKVTDVICGCKRLQSLHF